MIDRTFVLQGMLDNREAFESSNADLHTICGNSKGEGKGLLASFLERAHLLFIDDYPTYLPKIITQKSIELAKCQVRVVDSNGIIPIRLSERPFKTAYAFRRYMQKEIVEQLLNLPAEYPLQEAKKLPIVDSKSFKTFSTPQTLPKHPLNSFGELQNQVQSGETPSRFSLSTIRLNPSYQNVEEVTRPRRFYMNLSKFTYQITPKTEINRIWMVPVDYLHGSIFGHISSFEVVLRVLDKENWDPTMIQLPHNGRREGWWGLSESAEGFLDQIITWRELGFIFSHTMFQNMTNGSPFLNGRRTHLCHTLMTQEFLVTHLQTSSMQEPMMNCGMLLKTSYFEKE